MISSFDVVFYTLAFVVPGFLIDLFLRKFVPQEKQSDQHNVFYYLTLSFVNYAAWSWLIYNMMKNDYFTVHPILTGFLWFAIIFIGPLVIAIITLLLYKFKVLGKIAAYFKVNTVHPIPTAWDYKFSTITEKKWVVVVLENDIQIAGVWWAKSFASSVAEERDIYLEEVYTIEGEKGLWKKVPRTDGMYIKGNQIKLIQFWNDEIKGEKVE